MSTTPWEDRVGAGFAARFGGDAVVQHGFGPVGVAVTAERWVEALTLARDVLGCAFFDWLSAVDESPASSNAGPGAGLRVVCHLAARRTPGVEHLVVSTLPPGPDPVLPSAAAVFAGARWHERETAEMFGVRFSEPSNGGVDGAEDVLALEPLLLPDGFEGHPLRKDFTLASRVAEDWPGAKEPGESDASALTARSRRRARPLGAPDPGPRGQR